jgi:hypothetical protein
VFCRASRVIIIQDLYTSVFNIITFFIIKSLGRRPAFPPRAPSTGEAQRVDAALDGADEDVARGEVRVDGPGAVELGLAADLVVLRVDVEEAGLLEEGAGVVLLDRGDVDDAEAGAVVGLEGEAVDGVLVVVDGLLGGLVDAAEDGPGEVWVVLVKRSLRESIQRVVESSTYPGCPQCRWWCAGQQQDQSSPARRARRRAAGTCGRRSASSPGECT